jgi:hypothetical protein
MNIYKMVVLWSALIFCASFGNAATERMQPIQKDGCYYYNEADISFQHINLSRSVWFLGKRIFAVGDLIRAITSLFYKTKEEVTERPPFLIPLQAVPVQESVEPTITWVGHATVLVQINGLNILTDPLWGNVHAGPLQ